MMIVCGLLGINFNEYIEGALVRRTLYTMVRYYNQKWEKQNG